MQYSYENSVAQRWMQFRSSIQATEDVSTEIFNAVSVYIPSNLGAANIAGYADMTLPTVSTPLVLTVTVDNYQSVMAENSALLKQWGPVFLDGSNFDLTLYLIVFLEPGTGNVVTLGPDSSTYKSTIMLPSLSNAFEKLYHISYFKTMFAENYGQTIAAADTNPSIGAYWDEALCLAQLCENRPELSFGVFYATSWLPMAVLDSTQGAVYESEEAFYLNTTSLFTGIYVNKTTKVTDTIPSASDVLEEGGLASVLSWNGTSSAAVARAAMFAYCLGIVAPTKSWLVVHAANASYSDIPNMVVRIFASWFAEGRNPSGQFVGNKFEKARLTGSGIRPTGEASWLNSEANTNLSLDQMTRLEEYGATYFMSICDRYMNDCIADDATNSEGNPVTAYMIEKWIDYTTSQQLANLVTDRDTVTHPYLKNEETYQRVQDILLENIQKHARSGRLKDIQLNFPSYTELVPSDTDIIVGQGAWEATYVYPLRKVVVGGTINV